METKSPLLSKTIWINVLAVTAFYLQSKFGFVISPEDQIYVLGFVNLILRVITRKPLNWNLQGKQSGRIGYALTIALAALCMVLLLAPLALAKDVSLSWDPSPTQGVTGYKIHYNCVDDSQPFPDIVDVGDVLNTTVADLVDSQGCYFAVTAYNAAGMESGYSNIVYSQGFVPPQPATNLRGISTVNAINIPVQ